LPRAVAVVALALMLPLALAAQQMHVYRSGGVWVEETSGSLPASGRLMIRLPLGNIAVEGADQSRITYRLEKRVYGDEASARREFAQWRFLAALLAEGSVLAGDTADGHFHSEANLIVRVPRATELVRAFTHGGNESVANIAGRAEVSTGGGNLYLDNIGGTVTAATAGGNVEVGTVGGDLSLKSGGGTVRIHAVKGRIYTASGGGNIVIGSGQAIHVRTAGGQIDVKQCAGELRAASGGGNLELGKVDGRAFLQTGGGSIHLSSAAGPVVASTNGGAVELHGLKRGAEVQTGSGQITAEFLGANFSGSTLQTPSGDVIVYLSPNTRATIRADVEFAGGHRIRSDFPEIRVSAEGDRIGPYSIYAEGMLNGGGPLLRVRTTNGNIEFRRVGGALDSSREPK